MKRFLAGLFAVCALSGAVVPAASAYFVDDYGHHVYYPSEWNALNLTLQQVAQREAIGELIACVNSDEKPSDVGFNHVSC